MSVFLVWLIVFLTLIPILFWLFLAFDLPGLLNAIFYIPGLICGLFLLFLAFISFVFPHMPGNYTYAIAFLIPGLTLVIPTNLLTRKQSKLKLLKFIKIIILIICLYSALVTGEKVGDASQLVENCTGKEICPGRVEALETLVKNHQRLEGINVSGANLKGVNLSNGWFSDKYGTPSYFSDADLSGSNLSNSYLKEAYFNGSNLSNANLSDANLNDAEFNGANLSNANLSNTSLSYAEFNEANLSYADLNGANLRNSELTGASLYSANLDGANLSRANLYDAELTDVENLTESQIKSACNWAKAVYKDNKEEQKKYINQLKVDKDSDPEKSVDCSRWYQQ